MGRHLFKTRIPGALLAVLALTQGFAAICSEDGTWLCKEESSQREGNEIYSCGIGTGLDENAARANAFDNAKVEFKRICDSSDDCKGHMISVQPKRTSCESDGSKRTRCFRLIGFEIGPRSKQSHVSISAQDFDEPDRFQPFSYEEIAGFPKIKIGMKKADLLSLFGQPERVHSGPATFSFLIPYASYYSIGEHAQMLFYKGQMCSRAASTDNHCGLGFSDLEKGRCAVAVNEGEVVCFNNFDFRYTEDLK